MKAENDGDSSYGDIPNALKGSTILVTGGAGFFASALLCRLLLDPLICDSIKQVIAIIRGDTVESATARLPAMLHPFTHPRQDAIYSESEEAKLVVLNGDCGKIGFGLQDDLAEVAQRADIVIHAAGDVRFTLPLPVAIANIVDLAYTSSRFSLTSPRVKTHIFLSTTYVSWFLKHNSTAYEDFTQENIAPDTSENASHVNTYLHAKTLAESCVNGLFRPEAGRELHGKAVRIVRLATLGPAAEFPNPGWGAGHPSSPVCAAIAAQKVPLEVLSCMPDEGFLEIIPVDIAVNQLIALTAACHRTHQLPLDDLAHPLNPMNPANLHATNVPCYHIGTGLSPFYQASYSTLNLKEVKLLQPFIPHEQLMHIFKPFISKIVNFDNSRTRKALGIPPFKPTTFEGTLSDSSDASTSSLSHSSNNGEMATTNGTGQTPGLVNGSGIALKSELLGNISRTWSDPPISCGNLDVDCPAVIERLWGALGGENASGWIGYLKCVRDEMERSGSRAAECYVD